MYLFIYRIMKFEESNGRFIFKVLIEDGEVVLTRTI